MINAASVPPATPATVTPIQATAPAPIAAVDDVQGEVRVARADGTSAPLTPDTLLFAGDTLVSAADGSAALRFVDGMTMALGAETEFTLDQFDYDLASETGSGLFSAVRGVFSFISGQITKAQQDALIIETPTMTIGVRGTKVAGKIDAASGGTDIVLLPEADGTLGRLFVSTAIGSVLLEGAYDATRALTRDAMPEPVRRLSAEQFERDFSGISDRVPEPDAANDDQEEEQRAETSTLGLASAATEAVAAEIEDVAVPVPVTAVEVPGLDDDDLDEEELLDDPLRDDDERGSDTGAGDDGLLSVIDGETGNGGGGGGGGNTAPNLTGAALSLTVNENAPLNLDVTAAFTDADGDSLTYAANQQNGDPLPGWLSFAAGTFTGTPPETVGGSTVDVAVSASDPSGASVTLNDTISVTEINTGPVLSGATPGLAATEDSALSLNISGAFSDADGDTLSHAATLQGGGALPAWLNLSGAGTFTGTPPNSAGGTSLNITITATDTNGVSVSYDDTLAIAAVNDAPSLTGALPTLSATEGAPLNIDITPGFSDIDPGDSLSFSATLQGGGALPAWLNLSGAGTFTGTPDDAAGATSVNLTLRATDVSGDSVSTNATLTVTGVNDAPVLSDPGTLTLPPVTETDGNSPAQRVGDLVSGHISDLDGAAYNGIAVTAANPAGVGIWQFQASSGGAWQALNPGGVAAARVLGPDASLRFVPSNSGAGTPSVTFVAWDGTGSATSGDTLDISALQGTPNPFSSATADASISVAAVVVNNPPTSNVAASTLNMSENAAFNDDLTDDFTDLDGDTLNFSLSDNGVDTIPAWFTLPNGATTLAVTPPDDAAGASFGAIVTATDPSGDSADWAITVNVAAVNDAPVLSDPGDLALTTLLSDATDPAGTRVGDLVTGSISDVDGPAVEAIAVIAADSANGTWQFSTDAGASWTALSAPSLANATPLAANDQLRFIPNGGYSGAATLDFVAWDQTDASVAGTPGDISAAQGDSGAFSDDTATVTVTVTDVPALNAIAAGTANATETDEQTRPSITALNDGGFYIAWTSVAQDGDAEGVFARRFDAAGSARDGSDLQLNQNTSGKQLNPAAATLSTGDVVTIWRDEDSGNTQMYLRLVDAAGPVGNEDKFEGSTKLSEQPAIVALAGGGFAAVWTKEKSGEPEIYARVFDAAGDTVTGEIKASESDIIPTNGNVSPAIAALSDGGFVITWALDLVVENKFSIVRRVYAADGSDVASTWFVDQQNNSDQIAPDVAAVGDGFVVVWQSDHETDGQGVYGRYYDNAGDAQGDEFALAEVKTNDQVTPAISATGDGGFIAVWVSDDSGGLSTIKGRLFAADGTPRSSEMDLGQASATDQTVPDVTLLDNGNIVVTWQEGDSDREGVSYRVFETVPDTSGAGLVEFEPLPLPLDVAADVASAALPAASVLDDAPLLLADGIALP